MVDHRVGSGGFGGRTGVFDVRDMGRIGRG